MGMDMWLFKMKKEEEIKKRKKKRDCWDYDSGVNFDELNLVPSDNPYLEGWVCWGNEEYHLINKVIANSLGVKIRFYGDPICEQKDFDYAVDMLNKWYKEKYNGETEFIMKKEWGYSDDWKITIPHVDKLVEYLTIAKDNGFTMWFSF